MMMSKTITFFKKHWVKIVIAVGVIGLSVLLWIIDGYITFLTTIIAGLFVGLGSSFAITYIFEAEKKKSRDSMRELIIENFVYSCADYIQSLELWYEKHSGVKISILEKPDEVLKLLETFRTSYKDKDSSEVEKEFSMLYHDFVYSIGPVYYSYRQLDNQHLLLNDVLGIDEYKFFHNMIKGDIFDEFLSFKKKDRFGNTVKGYYIFHQLRVCLNCVLDAHKIFPEISEKYLVLQNKSK